MAGLVSDRRPGYCDVCRRAQCRDPDVGDGRLVGGGDAVLEGGSERRQQGEGCRALGLAGALLVGALPALHQLVVEAWHQTMVGFHLGPFVAAAQHAIAMLGTAMVACALALIFWPRSETVADGA